jgi:uncharacterized protein (TIGR04255 family)
MRFGKPPLVELIVELRWAAPPIVLPAGGAAGMLPGSVVASTGYEELFMRFGARAAAEGYSGFERLVPPGFPLVPFQPVYRYRKTTPEPGTTLYQLGVGLFSANITPPYKSWQAFRPIVEKGVAILLECREGSEKDSAFDMASLRYIDAFKPDLTQGRGAFRFLTEVLGFTVKLPEAIQRQTAPDVAIRPVLQFSIPLKTGLLMNLNVGEGTADGQEAVITDTSVLAGKEVPAGLATVMIALDSAHDAIHETFLGITQNIYELMEPKHEDKG